MAEAQTAREEMRVEKRATSEPLPYICPPSQQFDGNDGSWSTFLVSIGTPGQAFRVLPSTAGVETWVPDYQGCLADETSDCPSLRGAESFNGGASPGFQANRSSTWELIGLYTLDLENRLNYTGNGQYGYDELRLGSPTGSSSLSVNHSVVASVADKSYFLGLLPLSNRQSSVSSGANSSLSLLQAVRDNNQIPSLSYGYTAGAVYQGGGTPGSLTLGGYDATRFTPSNFSFAFGSLDAQPLQVGVQSIIAENTLLGTASLTQNDDGDNGFFAAIDSTVPELWLPGASCDAFAQALGLSLDNSTGYYLVNDTIHSQLTELNPRFTFKLGATDYFNGDAINIELPYAAFDLQLSWPIFDSPTNYFPLRRASNSSQTTLGRALLQEAYIIVDYERRNFSINQVNVSSSLPSPQIVTIQSLSAADDSDSSSSSSLSGGAIAGIVIGAIAGLALLGLLAFFLIRRKKRAARRHELDDTQVHDTIATEKKDVGGEANGQSTLPAEVGGAPVHELATPVGHAKHAPDSSYTGAPVQEAAGDTEWRHEMEAPTVRYEMSAGDEHIPKTPR